MPDQTVVNVLNRLLTLHSRSLPTYLASARPWFSKRNSEEEAVLRHIAADQKLMVGRIGTVIMDLGGSVFPSEFPMEFTDLHDLRADYLVGQVMERQQREIDWMRQNLDPLRSEPAALAIGEEALGAAQAHLDSLNELPDTVA